MPPRVRGPGCASVRLFLSSFRTSRGPRKTGRLGSLLLLAAPSESAPPCNKGGPPSTRGACLSGPSQPLQSRGRTALRPNAHVTGPPLPWLPASGSAFGFGAQLSAYLRGKGGQLNMLCHVSFSDGLPEMKTQGVRVWERTKPACEISAARLLPPLPFDRAY